MKNITLIEFLLKYNFKKSKNEMGFFSSNIKIFLSNNESNWIQYGLYDFDSIEEKEKRIINSLNSHLISRNVDYYYYDDTEETFLIFLEDEVTQNNG